MKKEFQKAHEQSVLVVGKTYLVAHVNVKNSQSQIPFNLDVPIIPIWHNDKVDFGFSETHYHIDGRFVSNSSKQAKMWRVYDGYSAAVVSEKLGNVVSEVFYLNKKCLRLNTGVPGVSFHAPSFIEKYKGKSCKGRKCPHWGTKMNEVDGVLICPMHRLKGDIDTEVITG